MTIHNFSVMAFPSGPLCNLNCSYCYYLNKAKDYRDSPRMAMDEELLERYVRQYIAASSGPYVNFGWQGGEPTIRGIEFYKKAVRLQKKYAPPEFHCQNGFQTNGVLLDDEWCRFFSENNFLVGISLDGPQHLHDIHRKYKNGQGSYEDVVRAVDLLKKHKVDFNVLCVVNKINAKQPVEVYNSFKKLGINFVQFIPLVESGDRKATEYTVSPGDYSNFLITIFNEWIKNDFGLVFIQIFEETLKVWAGQRASLCILSKTCGNALVMEHNGDVYSCDHFVSPPYKLGNIRTDSLGTLANSTKQREFGDMKYNSLPKECLDCEVGFICQGGCPKNRIVVTKRGEKINYLCADYKRFFTYVGPFMEKIVEGLKKGDSHVVIKEKLLTVYNQTWNIGRNDLCPCGSGRKYKKCCLTRK